MTVHSSDKAQSAVQVTVTDSKNQTLASGSGSADQAFNFAVSNPSLWTPDTPNLYNITVRMGSDVVTTYTGFRTFSKGQVQGVTRPLMNGEFFFAIGTLE